MCHSLVNIRQEGGPQPTVADRFTWENRVARMDRVAASADLGTSALRS